MVRGERRTAAAGHAVLGTPARPVHRRGVPGAVTVSAVLALLLSATVPGADLRVRGVELSAGGSLPTDARAAPAKKLSRYRCFRLGQSPKTLAASVRETTALRLRLTFSSEYDWSLVLSRSDPRGPSYSLRTTGPGGSRAHQPSEVVVFAGYVEGDPYSRVTLSFLRNGISGVVVRESNVTILEPLRHFSRDAAPGDIIIYRERDALHERELPAHFDLEGTEGAKPAGLGKRSGPQGVECAECQLAVAVDWSVLEDENMSIESTEERVVSLLAMVNMLYADPRINIRHVITELVIEEADENTFGVWATDAGSGIEQIETFRTWAGSPDGFTQEYDCKSFYCDVRSGITGYSMGRVCRNATHSVRGAVGWAAAKTWAHELGHGFDASHTSEDGCIMKQGTVSSEPHWCDEAVVDIVSTKNSASCLSPCEATGAIGSRDHAAPGRRAAVARLDDADRVTVYSLLGRTGGEAVYAGPKGNPAGPGVYILLDRRGGRQRPVKAFLAP